MAIAVPIEFAKPAQCAQRMRLEPAACRRDAIPRVAPLGVRQTGSDAGLFALANGIEELVLELRPAVPQEVAARHEPDP